MNHYKYEEIMIGQKEQFDVIITEKMVNQFCEITGDINPLHNDQEFAKQK